MISAVATSAGGYLAAAALAAGYIYRALRTDFVARGVRNGGDRRWIVAHFNRSARSSTVARAAQRALFWPLTLPVFVIVRTARLLTGKDRL